MTLNIYEVAAENVSIREAIHSFDVDRMRAARSCLGTSEGLETDAVRFVLVDMTAEAERYFRTAIKMAEAAVEAREKYVYDSPEIASFFAYRVAFISAWALGDDRASAFADQALDIFAEIAAPDDYRTDHPSHPIAATLLLAAHAGRAERLISRLSIPRPCRERHEWCRVFELSFGVARGLSDLRGIETFFATRVRAPDLLNVVAEGCPVSAAVSFAALRNRAAKCGLSPFEVIRTLRAPAG